MARARHDARLELSIVTSGPMAGAGYLLGNAASDDPRLRQTLGTGGAALDAMTVALAIGRAGARTPEQAYRQPAYVESRRLPTSYLRFSQQTASPRFNLEGSYTAQTVGSLAAGIRNGSVSASDIRVEYVNLAGNQLIVNTRSALALTRAGVPQSEWTLAPDTPTHALPILRRLSDNRLTIEGTEVVRITGLGRTASSLE